MHTNTTGGPHDRQPEPKQPDAVEQLLAEAERITSLYETTAARLSNDVLKRKPYADPMVASRYESYASAMRVMTNSLKVRAQEIAAPAVQVCPFDCDGCHDEDCPCDRSGCAGSETGPLH